jgi:hypothetical protein
MITLKAYEDASTGRWASMQPSQWASKADQVAEHDRVGGQSKPMRGPGPSSCLKNAQCMHMLLGKLLRHTCLSTGEALARGAPCLPAPDHSDLSLGYDGVE